MSNKHSIDLAPAAGRSLSPGVAAFPRWQEILFLLLLPPLTFWFFNYRFMYQAGSLDPFFYTGYINEPEDLLKRFGLLYYAVRFGLILPGRFFTWALGPEPGYLAFRYVLALLAGVPFYFFAKRKFSLPVAIVSYCALIVSPWFARTLLWDHPDAAGVPYMMAAMCAVLLSRKAFWLRDGLAGACVSLAVNTNIFTVAILGIFGAVYCAASLLYGTGWRTLLRRGLAMLFGGLLAAAAGYCYYWQAFGEPRNIFKPTIGMATYLSSGGMEHYRRAGAAWIFEMIYVLVPVLLGACCLITVARRRMRFELAVCAGAGIAVIAFYYTHQFLLHGDTLQLHYYFSYSLPSTFLLLACMWQELWERFEGRARVFIGVAAGAALAPLLLISAGVVWMYKVTPIEWMCLAVAAIVAVALARVHWQSKPVARAAILASLVLIAISMATGFTHGVYRIARPFRAQGDTERDLYRVTLAFLKEVPKLRDGPGNVLFWYTSRPNSIINSVQASYLWGLSNLGQLGTGMPRLATFQLTQLRHPDLRYLAILAETPQEVQEGLSALDKSGMRYDLLSTRDLHSGTLHVYWQLIEVIKRPD